MKKWILVSFLSISTATAQQQPLIAAADFKLCAAVQTDDAVVQGQGYWMYGQYELKEKFSLTDAVSAGLKRLNDSLERQGIQLVAAVVPTRPSMTGQFLPPLATYTPGVALASYKAFLQTMRSAGITAVDLAPALNFSGLPGQTPQWQMMDVHWSSSGAQAAGKTISDTLRKLPAYVNTPKTKFVLKQTRINEWGSSYRKLAVDKCNANLPKETRTLYDLTSDKKLGLLDDDTPPLVVLGTSFTYNFFLGQQIQVASDLDASIIGINGGGPYGALEQFFTSPTFLTAQPKFIVWELPIWYTTEIIDLVKLRQITAASESNMKFTSLKKSSAGANIGLRLLNIPTATSDLYAYIKYTDKSVRKFSVEINYANGKSETVLIDRSDRLENSGNFYLELSSPVTSLSVAPVIGTGDVNLEVRQLN